VVRPVGFEPTTSCLEAVRVILPNLARGVANRTESASWANSRKLPSPTFAFICRTFVAVFRDLRYIFVTGATINLTR
jgi:hypothetical protein